MLFGFPDLISAAVIKQGGYPIKPATTVNLLQFSVHSFPHGNLNEAQKLVNCRRDFHLEEVEIDGSYRVTTESCSIRAESYRC
jgi:hypothetical protein